MYFKGLVDVINKYKITNNSDVFPARESAIAVLASSLNAGGKFQNQAKVRAALDDCGNKKSASLSRYYKNSQSLLKKGESKALSTVNPYHSRSGMRLCAAACCGPVTICPLRTLETRELQKERSSNHALLTTTVTTNLLKIDIRRCRGHENRNRTRILLQRQFIATLFLFGFLKQKTFDLLQGPARMMTNAHIALKIYK